MITEKQMRRILQKNGYSLRKSRVQTINPNNYSGYQIVFSPYNAVVAGSNYELDAGDVLSFIVDHIGRPKRI